MTDCVRSITFTIPGQSPGKSDIQVVLTEQSDGSILVDLQTKKNGLMSFTNLAAIRGVRFVADEGRSWLARSRESFDVIQMSLVDTWAATGAGAFTLSENGLYTVDAWKIFLGRLTAKGVLAVSRWYEPASPDETGRMVSLAD